MATPERYDIIIVGAGPAGLSAAARAQANNLRYLVLKKAHWPTPSGTTTNTVSMSCRCQR